MRKRTIGCGVVLALVLGALIWAAAQIAPALQAAAEAGEAVQADLQRLDERYPWDGGPDTFSAERFERFLDLRVDLRTGLEGTLRELDARARDLQQQEMGFFEAIGVAFEVIEAGLQQVAPALREIPRILEAGGMGSGEFLHYDRILLATLERIDAGLGPEALEPLSGRFERLEADYAKMPESVAGQPLPAFDELVGQVDSTVLMEAEQVMASRLSVVEAGLTDAQLEFLYITLLSTPREGAATEGADAAPR